MSGSQVYNSTVKTGGNCERNKTIYYFKASGDAGLQVGESQQDLFAHWKLGMVGAFA